MNTYRRWWQAIFAALLLVVTIAAWVIFAPVQIGGQAGYVIVNGQSMEPNFHYGDLVIVHQAASYTTGDSVVYHSAELKSFVFHRIVGMNLDHFILKGDNNGWIDSYQPAQDELIGKLWIYIPKAGNIVKWLRTPIVMALFVGTTGIILLAIFMGGSIRGKKMKNKPRKDWFGTVRVWVYGRFSALFKSINISRLFKRKQTNAITLASSYPAVKANPTEGKKFANIAGSFEIIFFILGFIAIAAFILGIFTFTRPILQNVADNVNYQQTGRYSYNTTAPAGIYDTTTVTSGAPLFPKLNCSVNLQFNYALLGDQLAGLAGTHQLTAVILDDTSGWQRTLPLESQQNFTGNSFEATASLNLCRLESIVAGMEAETDLHPSYYSLMIDPRITVTGKVAGRDLQTTFEPQLLFLFDKVHFYIYKKDAVTDPLNFSQPGLIEDSKVQANVISILGLKPEVGKLRTVAVVGFALSVGGLLLLSLLISNRTKHSQEAQVSLKYNSLLVDIEDRALETSLPGIDVMTMDDLAKLAERNNSLILHQARGQVHHYFVQGDRITYRYKINDGDQDIPEAIPVDMEENLRRGIDRGEFQVYYQPIVSLPDGNITAVEALLRWQHPERGLVSAAEFIFAAEKSGLIDRMGEWMLQVACAQYEEWQKAGINVKLAVNLSKRQLEEQPAEFISRVLHQTGMDPHALQIEIPEASIIENDPAVIANLQKLTDLGIQLSVDNFSGGLALSALDAFQIKNVKIDRRLVSKISNPDDAAIFRGMISAVQNTDLNLVVEGVETQEQLVFLQDQNCSHVQGYLLGRPAPAIEETRILELGRSMNMPQNAKKKSPRKGGVR